MGNLMKRLPTGSHTRKPAHQAARRRPPGPAAAAFGAHPGHPTPEGTAGQRARRQRGLAANRVRERRAEGARQETRKTPCRPSLAQVS